MYVNQPASDLEATGTMKMQIETTMEDWGRTLVITMNRLKMGEMSECECWRALALHILGGGSWWWTPLRQTIRTVDASRHWLLCAVAAWLAAVYRGHRRCCEPTSYTRKEPDQVMASHFLRKNQLNKYLDIRFGVSYGASQCNI